MWIITARNSYVRPTSLSSVVPFSSQPSFPHPDLPLAPAQNVTIIKSFTGHPIPTVTGPTPSGISTEFLIPNVVHFVRSQPSRSFGFTELLSVFSAIRFQKPVKIVLHCPSDPTGQWWTHLLTNHTVTLHHTSLSRINEQDGIRLLRDAGGGILLSTDDIMVQSLDPLRRRDFVIGADESKLDFGVLLASADSKFLEMLLEIDPADLPSKAYKLAQSSPSLALVVPETLTFPGQGKRYLLFNAIEHLRWWKKNYIIRFRFRNQEPNVYNPEYIQQLKSPIGQMLRLIYYGSSDIIDPYLPHVLYATLAKDHALNSNL
jgi:hypothetical protein